MYRIAVFSDIHGNKEALDAIIADIANEKVDETIFLGDAIGLGPDPKYCLNKIADSNITWVLGNHDLYFLKGLEGFNIESQKINHTKWVISTLNNDDKNRIKDYKVKYTISVENHTFTFAHYFVDDERKLYPFYGINTIKSSNIKDIARMFNSDYFFYGHDHTPSKYCFEDKYIIDVGSSGCTKTNKTFYTIIDIDKTVKIYTKTISFDYDKLINKLESSAYPQVSFITNNFFK